MWTRQPSSDWLATHRQVWTKKRGLRQVYTRWFHLLRAACAPGAPVVELGCGPGFLKTVYPDVIATDTVDNPFADRMVDAAALPFGEGEVANLVMLDVFHHIADPLQFVREAARVLQPGGRIVMIEPWIGLSGSFLYRYVHHEHCDLRADPAAPWRDGPKDAMQGNMALPYLYFRSGGYLEHIDLPLAVVERQPFAALPWLLSGGFQPFSLVPAALVGPLEAVDRCLSLLPSLTASRCLIVVEKGAGRPSRRVL
jgi:SAM-dependent methyltransferase